MTNVLVDVLARNLQIGKFSDETKEEYGQRLIYTAVAAWVRVSLLGKSYSDLEFNSQEDSVDIMHVMNRGASAAMALICSIPHGASWLLADVVEAQGKYVVWELIRNMVTCQEISRLKNKRRLTISPQHTFSFGDHMIATGGIEWQNESNTIQNVGLGRWMAGTGKNGKLADFMGVPVLSAEAWLNELIRDTPWKNIEILDDWYIFQPSSNEIRNSGLWRIYNPTKLPLGVSLGKNQSQDYGLIIKRNSELQIMPLDQWFYKEKEIYRIMYALNARAGKPSFFEAQDHGDYVIAQFHSGIPIAEEKILLLASWPYQSIRDRQRRVIPNFLWPKLKAIFEHMGIQWVVKLVN